MMILVIKRWVNGKSESVYSCEFPRSAPYVVYRTIKGNIGGNFDKVSIHDGDEFLIFDDGVESAYYVDFELDTLVAMDVSETDTDDEFNMVEEIDEPDHDTENAQETRLDLVDFENDDLGRPSAIADLYRKQDDLNRQTEEDNRRSLECKSAEKDGPSH